MLVGGVDKLLDGATTCMDTVVPTFIDVFAGAGGLSLGLMMAGWRGLFAVEKSPMAFQTLKYNLVDQNNGPQFDWPDWLPIEAIDIQTLLEKYREQLEQLQGIPLLAGGPPCQDSVGEFEQHPSPSWCQCSKTRATGLPAWLFLDPGPNANDIDGDGRHAHL